MTMRTIIAIACLGLLLWVEPAGAQKTYSLTVSRHPDVALSAADVDKILADASKMLQKTSEHRRLLPPRCEWPSGRRTAKQRDELAPPDVEHGDVPPQSVARILSLPQRGRRV
jgi:hypothetical protein